MPAAIDLHMHTYFSDGRLSPAELLQECAAIGLRVISITDHDTTAGWREAVPLAARLGLTLIPGVEMTTTWAGCPGGCRAEDIDLLGYFIDPGQPAFATMLREAQDDNAARMSITCARLTEAGYPIGMDDLALQNPHYSGLVHIIQVLLRKRLAATWKEAEEAALQQWRRVRPARLTIARAIQDIHAAGGVSVLAHPTAITTATRYLNAAALEQLVEAGLDGVEVYHRRLDDAARRHFLGLAQQYRLVVTGGSDEHAWQNGYRRLGSQPVTDEMLTALCAAAGQPPA